MTPWRIRRHRRRVAANDDDNDDDNDDNDDNDDDNDNNDNNDHNGGQFRRLVIFNSGHHQETFFNRWETSASAPASVPSIQQMADQKSNWRRNEMKLVFVFDENNDLLSMKTFCVIIWFRRRKGGNLVNFISETFISLPRPSAALV